MLRPRRAGSIVGVIRRGTTAPFATSDWPCRAMSYEEKCSAGLGWSATLWKSLQLTSDMLFRAKPTFGVQRTTN